MKRFTRYAIAGLTLLIIVFLPPAVKAQNSLDSLLLPYLSKYELPALAAAVVKDGKIISVGAVGTRRAGETIPVTINDRFHLGSDTKAMTSLMMAILVEQGKLRWDSTIGEIFPERAKKMSPSFKDLTVLQLLSHTSGIPSDNTSRESDVFTKCIADYSSYPNGNLNDIRYWLVSEWVKLPLPSRPGKKFEYSNINYTIAGAIIERIEKKSWDELIVERVFKPLHLETAGLGAQASLGKIDAPLGHAIIDGKIKAFLAGPFADNPPVIGPAGIAHMSIIDFAKWAGWNAGEGKRGPNLIRPETMRKLHSPVITIAAAPDAPPGTPPRGKYALGWGEMTFPWAPSPLISHNGSNGMNLALILLDTKRDLAIVILTNMGGEKADEALKELSRDLYVNHATK
jgi:CubicO group peptidase (beta-lactamase class C family)